MAAQTGTPREGGGAGRDWKQYTRFGFIGILVVLALVFIFQNTQRVTVEFLAWGFSLQMWIMLLIIFVIGILAGLLVSWRRARARRRKYR